MGEIELKFWNRKKELQQVKDTLNPFLYISSPPFFGKTFLLQKLREEYKQQGWNKVFYFSITNLLALEISSKDDVLNYIAKGLGFENHVRLRVCVTNKDDKLLIIIDDLHILANKSNKQLKEFFLAIFLEYKGYMPNASNFQLILAGRYIDCIHFKLTVPFHSKKLNPEPIKLQPFKAEDVLLILESYLRDVKLFIETDNEKYQQWSKNIHYLSCGNPKAILMLVEHIVSKSQKDVLAKSYVENNAAILFNAFVQPLLDEILAELSDSVRDTLRCLSIFEEFDLSTLSFLEEKKLLKESGHINILETLGILGTICSKDAENPENPYYSDAILTEMLKRSVELRDVSLYILLHKYALEFYSKICKSSFKNKIFYLYHSLLLKQKDNVIISLKELLTSLKDIEKLKNYLYGDDLINKLLEQNPELEELLNNCLTQIGI